MLTLLAITFLAACQSQEVSTPEPSATPAEPTLEPSATIDWFPRTPTPTPQVPVDMQPTQATPATPLPEALIAADDFSNQELWQTSTSTAGTIAYETNALSLAVAGGKNTLTSLSSHGLPSNFYLEINLDTQMGSPEDQFGLILWSQSSSGTLRVWFRGSGEVMLDRVLPSGVVRLQEWQAARRFELGSPAHNRIGVRSVNNTLEVYVNQTHQFTYSPLNNLTGPLGVIAQTGGEFPLTIRVSDLQILEP